MMKKNVRCMMTVFMVMAMLCGLNGCGNINDNEGTEQIATGVGDEQIIDEVKEEQTVDEMGDNQFVEQDNSDERGDTVLNEERNDAEKAPNEQHNDIKEASAGEDLDVAVTDPADDDWYMKGNIYTDDKGNRLEVYFNDHGTLEFTVNGLSLYFTAVDNVQQENNWKVYTCDDGTMIIYYPGEPAHLEISEGDYAGVYEAGGDKMK